MNDISLHLASETDLANVALARSVAGVPYTVRKIPYRNIAELLHARVEKSGDKIWLIFYPEQGSRKEYSYRQFLALVRKTAALLTSFGIRRGDRICTVGVNRADTVVQYFAAWFLGVAVVPVNIGEDDKRIAYVMENSHAKLAFVQTAFIQRISALRSQISGLVHILEVGEEASGFFPSYNHELEKMSEAFQAPDPAELSDEALIVYTSGTTGLPKGVVLEQYNLLIDAKGIADWHGMDDTQRMMCVLPLHHVNGTVVTLLTPMYFGGSVVLNQKFHTRTFFERIAKEHVNVVSVVPTLLQFLLHENIDHGQFDLSRFRHIICGAGPLTCDLADRFERTYRIPIIHGYGLSETTCYSCFLPIDLTEEQHRHWLQDFGFPSIGVAIPGNEMDIHSNEGISLPEGERGEIVIRGHNVMKYYYKNQEANASSFANQWFRSGDEGFYLKDGNERKFFFITGRLKELIIRGGVNIAPLEIDEVINSCPGVKAGIAVGFENDWYGEEVGALVQKGDVALTEEQVIERCKMQLPYSKCPKVVIFSEEIPVTSTGKYQRNKVKHLFEAWKNVQFPK